jgi:telomerase protein component 1
MEYGNLVGSVIQDPFERAVIRVSACMISEPKFYETAENRVKDIISDLSEVVKLDPEFVCKLAYYSRNELNLRSTSNFIAAWAATQPPCFEFLTQYFNYVINLPSDLLDFLEKFQILTGNLVKPKFPSFIQRLVKSKFCEFNVYQLGKYCSEGKRKRLIMKEKHKGKISMKTVVRACHVKRPAILVASIIGKRYPETIEDFNSSSFAAESEFKPELAGKRMKIPTPETWETILSAEGNKPECWEKLIKSNKLPFMATLRNLRNLLITGVDEDTHNKVMNKLSNPDVIQNSRLFPFRFLSAYESIKLDLEELEKLKNDPLYDPFDELSSPEFKDPSERGFGRGPARRGTKRIASSIKDAKSQKKRKIKIPNVLPTPELISRYTSSLEEAIKLATALNVSPIRGHTVIFCDASGSMRAKISSGAMGSIRTCMDLGYLFGLMLRHVCETSEVYLLSSPNPPQILKCWKKIELEGDNIFDLLDQVRAVSDEMGRDNEYPYDWFEDIIAQKLWIDNIIIFSDMIISNTCSEMFNRAQGYSSSYEILKKYRDNVNPNVRYITVDLAGYARDMSGANFEDKFKNIVIGGYSDAILKLVSATQTSQADAVRACKPVKRGALID